MASPYKKQPISYQYGTAGFRMKASLLDCVLYRVGLLAVLRSKSLKGQYVGIMITASHNPAEDNGVKLVDPMGNMLAADWESYATMLANAEDDQLVIRMNDIIHAEKIDMETPANVVVGRDTRPSGAALLQALKDAVSQLNGKLMDFGWTTTPQLHYITLCLNTVGTPLAYGEPSENGYYKKLSTAFINVMAGKEKNSMLIVDAANGIGAIALKRLADNIGSNALSVHIINDSVTNADKLNKDCGADFVKVGQKAPLGIDFEIGKRYASLDGDADRLVYYYKDVQGQFRLLDGDKIATLAAGFLMELVNKANVRIHDKRTGTQIPLSVGLVQTAYANGSSTHFVKEQMKVPVVFTPTGVKYLHHAAEEFDIGVYFEANGHGTVLFSRRALEAFRQTEGKTTDEIKALNMLYGFSELINQTVGDALSDLLMVEAILAHKNMSLDQWNAAYTDLPSRQEKVKVQNRTIFIPIKADTELARPEGLQSLINAESVKFKNGRCFVRPSGTEDIVRVYAEADTAEHADLLAYTICGIIFDRFGGVGERPLKFPK